jgi:hypothetical protein
MKRPTTFEPKKKLRIIVLVHQDLVPPDTLDGLNDKEKAEVKTEYDVISRRWATRCILSASTIS